MGMSRVSRVGLLLAFVAVSAALDTEAPIITLDLSDYNPATLTEVEFDKEKTEIFHAQVRTHSAHPHPHRIVARRPMR
jgi:hypothetical protein